MAHCCLEYIKLFAWTISVYISPKLKNKSFRFTHSQSGFCSLASEWFISGVCKLVFPLVHSCCEEWYILLPCGETQGRKAFERQWGKTVLSENLLGDQMQIYFWMQIYFLQHISFKNIDSCALVYSLSYEQVMSLKLLFWERFFRPHSQNAKRLCRKAVNSQIDQISDGFWCFLLFFFLSECVYKIYDKEVVSEGSVS